MVILIEIKMEELHEIIAVFINISIFIIPLEILVWFVAWRRYHLSRREANKINVILNLTAVLLMIVSIAIFIFYINVMSTEGSSNKIEKFTNEQGFYMKLDDRIIQISKGQYNLIEDEKWYHFKFKYNKLIPDKYKLIILEEDE
jgi:glucan phosphoethanolaminetransferase (alkaline phosphatase superfamily)